jgi:VCBS repeat-containing protein
MATYLHQNDYPVGATLWQDVIRQSGGYIYTIIDTETVSIINSDGTITILSGTGFTGGTAGTVNAMYRFDATGTVEYEQITGVSLSFAAFVATASGTALFTNHLLNSADTMTGGTGDDTIRGFGNTDTISGGAGNDTIDGGAGTDTIFGGAGNDTIAGGTGGDWADYSDISGAGNGITGTVNGTVTGALSGTDTLTGIENIRGTQAADTITGDGANNRLEGQGGDNVLIGLGGNDTLIGDSGADTLVGGLGNDTLTGGTGTDTAVIGGVAATGSATQVSATQVTVNVEGTDTLNSMEEIRFTQGTVDESDDLTFQIVSGNTVVLARADSGAADEDGASISGNVLTNDIELESGETKTVAQVNGSGANVGVAIAGSNGGTFTIGSNGAWTFDPGAGFQDLDDGETRETYVTYKATDGTDVGNEVRLTVTVTGADDVITITGDTVGDLDEDGASIVETGTLTAAGDGEVAFEPVTEEAPGASDNGYGTFTIDASGNWAYTLDNGHEDVQALGNGDTLEDKFTVSTTGGVEQEITITIHGTNDAPVVTGDGVTADEATEDSDLTTSGTLTIEDTDTGESSFVPQVDVATAYGAFSLDANGNWSYELDNDNTDVQALGEGSSITDDITVTTFDGSTRTLSITINGTNDGAVIAAGGSDDTDVTEETDASASGQLTISDTDTGEGEFQAVTEGASDNGYGTFSIGADGIWSYTLTSSHPEVDALGDGDELEDAITVSSIDGTTYTITIDITGTNDTPTVAVGETDDVAVTEDDGDNVANGLTAGGQLSIADADEGESSFVEQTETATLYGHFSIDESGVWTYLLDHALANSLTDGQAVTDEITVETFDGTTTTLTVTITGSNDLPTITVVGEPDVSVKEDTAGDEEPNNTASGQLSISDDDDGESIFQEETDAASDGGYGTFSVDATGAWTYTLDDGNAAVQALGAGDTLEDSITILAADDTPTTITITIAGTNDPAVFTVVGVPVLDVKEDATASDTPGNTASGQLSLADIDADEAYFTTPSGDDMPAYGFVNLVVETGEWFYILDNANPAVQALPEGETLEDSFTVRSGDGTGHVVTITIEGTNDGAVIGGTNTGEVIEDNVGCVSGTLTIEDVDTGEASFDAGSFDTSYGSFSIDETGAWHYTLDNGNAAVNALGDTSEPLVESITVTSLDGTEHTVTITIHGANELVIGTPDDDALNGSNIDDTIVGDSGDDVIGGRGGNDVILPGAGDDVVSGGSGTDTVVLSGAWREYSISQSGAFTEVAHDNGGSGEDGTDVLHGVENLRFGTGEDAITTTIADALNDAPVLDGDADITAGFDESGGGEPMLFFFSGEAIDLAANVTDADSHLGDVLTVTFDLGEEEGLPPGFWLDGTTLFVDPGHPAFDHLAQGAEDIYTFDYTLSDVHGESISRSVTVTINGTNDAPTVHCAIRVHTTEDAEAFTIDLTTNVYDADDGHVLHIENLGELPDGITLGEDGLTLTVDPGHESFQDLAQGETRCLYITFDVVDEHDASTPHMARIKVCGINDAPTVSGIVEAGAEEDGETITVDLLTNADDIDNGNTLHVEGIVGALPAGVTLSEDGNSIIVDPADASFQHLGAGDTTTITISYNVVDEYGAPVPQSVEVTITGTNDVPTVTGDFSGSATEDADVVEGNLVVSGSLSASDTDDDESGFQPASYESDYGTLEIAADGSWTFTADNDSEAIQGLAHGQTLAVEFTVHTVDGTEHTITISLHGVNDAPVGGDDTASMQENLTSTGFSPYADDIDDDDLTFTIVDDETTDGALFHLDSETGELVFNSAPDYESPADGDGNNTYIVKLQASDGNGGVSDPFTITITVTDEQGIIVGTPDDDFMLEGTEENDLIDGLGGNDVIAASPGNDAIDGGEGTDIVYYGDAPGAVTADLVAGTVNVLGFTQTLTSVEGIVGSDTGNDSLTGNGDDNLLVGLDGNDSLYGGDGDDELDGGAGNDHLDGGAGTHDHADFQDDTAGVTVNLISGHADGTGSGHDTLAGIEDVTGGHGADNLIGNSRANLLIGNEGDDNLIGNGGADVLIGYENDDTLAGGTGVDTAVYRGSWNEYTITFDEEDGYFTIHDNVAGRDGTDIVTDVEMFGFSNGSVSDEDLIEVAPSSIGFDPLIIPENAGEGTFVGRVTGFDANPLDVLSFSLTGDAGGRFALQILEGGVFQIVTGATPLDFEFAPSHVIEITATDLHGQSFVQTFTIEVDNTPVAVDDSGLETDEDTPITIDPAALLANDTSLGDVALTVTGVGDATNGTVALVDGEITFTPAANFHGTASFSYTIEDANGETDTGTVSITVNPVNDDPVAVADAGLTTTEDTALTIAPATLLGNDSDVDGDTLTITSVGSAAGGTVAIVDGSVVFTPAANYSGPASFSYTISDGHGGTATGTVDLTVTAVNDAPVMTSGAANISMAENLVATGYTAAATDVDSSPLTYQIAGGADAAKFSINATTGALRFVTAPNFEAPTDANGDNVYEVQVRASDGTLTSAPVAVNVTVTNVSGTFTGDDGNNVLVGTSEEDQLFGGAGNDILYGLGGSDGLYGGDGNDAIVADTTDEPYLGGAGFDTLYLSGAGNQNINMAGIGFEAIVANGGSDVIDGSGVSTGVTVYAGGGNDTITGGVGNDVLVGQGGIDSYQGGAGNDIIYADSDDLVILGGDGTDSVVMVAGSTANLALAGRGIEQVYGNSGNDVFDNSGGTAGVVFVSGAGNDTLIGGSATDRFYGGSGADSFGFATGGGNDVIQDWLDGEDSIDLTQVTGVDAFADLVVTSSGANAIVNYGSGSIFIVGGAGLIDASDFEFGPPAP